MKILYNQIVNKDPRLLREAWISGDSFLLVPDRAGIEEVQLHDGLKQLPLHMRTNHFGLLTSGSTGVPKIIIGTRQRSESLARVLHQVQKSDDVAETLLLLPLSYSYAFVNQWLWSEVHNRQLTFSAGFSTPDLLLDQLKSANSAMLCLVGGQVPLLKRYFTDYCFPGVIRLHFAGGRFPQHELEFLQKIFPNAQVYNNFGCAEALPRLTLREAGLSDQAANIGRPLPGVELRSEAGKLRFRSPYGAVAFVDNGELILLDEQTWVPTGDLGSENPDGSWSLDGRANEIFNRYGEKVSMPLLLHTVNEHWNGDAAFYTMKDNTGEDGCVLVLSPRPEKDQVRSILAGFRKHHTRAHWPLMIQSLDNLPCLPNGKPDLIGLRDSENKLEHWRQRI